MQKFNAKLALGTALGLSLLTALTAPAIRSTPEQDSAAGARATITPDDLRSLLEKVGAAPEAFTDEAGDPAFHVTLNGLKAGVYLYERKGESFGSIQLCSGFSGKIESATVNAWNRKYRFSRAYLGRDGHARIESDLDVCGVTDATITRFVDRFKVSVSVFQIALSEGAGASPEANESDDRPAQSV